MQKIYSVSQINTYIRTMFSQDFILNRISIRGEVSNCKYHTSGHIYFSLKDSGGTIACIMFAGARKGLAFRMSDGQQVVVDGAVNVYERDGKYQLYANCIRRDGAGLLYERYLELKQELEEMGMFAAEYKKPIPSFASTIGVVTASTGAAIRDIIHISRRRNPGIRIILYPAKVQGEGAAESIAKGLASLDALGLDVIIVGRGGGSIEDLWAFNEEIVARAIFSCQTPVISAVGHETDTTIADFVADLRAPTPSAAAELAVRDVSILLRKLSEQREQMNQTMEWKIHQYRMKAMHYRRLLLFYNPVQRVYDQRQRSAFLQEELQQRIHQKLTEKKHQMYLYIEKIKAVSPLEKLAQGYASVTDQKDQKIYSSKQVKKGDQICIYVSDGIIEAQVVKSTAYAEFSDELSGCGRDAEGLLERSEQ